MGWGLPTYRAGAEIESSESLRLPVETLPRAAVLHKKPLGLRTAQGPSYAARALIKDAIWVRLPAAACAGFIAMGLT
jgi:hypothetical protein